MSAPTKDAPTAAYRSAQPTGRDGFVQLLHAEWTKLRSVRGWVIGVIVAAMITVVVGLLAALGSHASACRQVPGRKPVCTGIPAPPTGPGGVPVNDEFTFVHQPLVGDGSITVRVSDLSGVLLNNPASAGTAGVEPWAKAGLIMKENTTVGAPYAAIMVTGAHGVRFQYNFTHDVAGTSGAVTAGSPRWLRLTRTGDTFAGYESSDGTHWTQVGSAHLNGIPNNVAAGPFVTSPQYVQVHQGLGGSSGNGYLTQATARFDGVTLSGNWPADHWTGTHVGGSQIPRATGSGFTQSGSGLTVTGSGDIAPVAAGNGPGQTLERTLVGVFAGLIALAVVATTFATSEYRRGLIRTTLAASPRRGRVLAAKSIVVAVCGFVAGLVGAAIALPLGSHVLRSNGNVLYPTSTMTDVRVIVGTGALFAVVAVLTLALGIIMRRSAGPVTAVIVAIVLPYILATGAFLPVGVAQWLLRVTPAAAFAVQQTLVRYPQVAAQYAPVNGYYPLSAWAGFAVLCGYTAAALVGAAILLRRRDA